MKKNQERIVFWHELFNERLNHFTPSELIARYKREKGKIISPSTLKADLKELKEVWKAPIQNKRFGNRDETLNQTEKSHYRYTNDFQLKTKITFTNEDTKQIEDVLSLLPPFLFLYLPQLKDLQIRLSKIKQQLNEEDHSSNKILNIIGFDRIPQLRGIDYLSNFYNAIVTQKTKLIYYKPFDGLLETFTLHPYYLKQFRNRWYVYGLHADENQVLPFALDRIIRVEDAVLPFTPNTYINFNTYFTHLIGISYYPNDETSIVRLKVKKARAFYIDTKPWHPSQVLEKEEDTYMIFKFYLVLNKELEAQILEFGKDVEVLEPLSLRQNIYNILQEAIRYYQ